MKNYLGNLIARHLNQAEVLQPRQASRFEPQSSVLGAEAEAETEMEVFQPRIGADNVATPDAASPDLETAATEFPLVPDLDGPVTRPAIQPPRTTETALDPSGTPSAPPASPARPAPPTPPVGQQVDATVPPSPVKFQPSVSVLMPPAEAPVRATELNEPEIVLTEQREKPIEQTSNTPSTQIAEPFASKTPVEKTGADPMPAAPSSTRKTEPVRKMNPVAVTAGTEDVEERLPVEPDQPRSTRKHSARTRRPRASQILTPSSTIDLQPHVAEPATGTAKELAVANNISRPAVYNVAPAEVRRDTAEPVKSRHTEAPAVVEPLSPLVLPPEVTPLPAAPKLPTIDSAEKQTPIRVSRTPPAPTSLETRHPHQTQRAPFLETREVSASQNHPMNVRRKFPEEETAAEVGPTVNVTIGRIEVRAATQIPEAQPQKQRREHQVLSLDDYLNQRSAGGR